MVVGCGRTELRNDKRKNNSGKQSVTHTEENVNGHGDDVVFIKSILISETQKLCHRKYEYHRVLVPIIQPTSESWRKFLNVFELLEPVIIYLSFSRKAVEPLDFDVIVEGNTTCKSTFKHTAFAYVA